MSKKKKQPPTVSKHLKNIFGDSELGEIPVIRNFRITIAETDSKELET
jgi:hypothetical protein